MESHKDWKEREAEKLANVIANHMILRSLT